MSLNPIDATVSQHRIDRSCNSERTFLRPVGDYLRRVLTSRVPRFVETWHLTILTMPLAALVVYFGFRARENTAWVWLISLAVLLQYVTDVLDGELGRQRKTGLVRWGFYLDHLSDAVFIAAVICAYMFLYQASIAVLVVALVLSNTLFLHEALAGIACGTYNRYGHHRIGLEEGRALVILVNAAVAIAKPDWIPWVFVGVVIVLGFLLLEQVIVVQRRLWRLDLRTADSGRAGGAGTGAVQSHPRSIQEGVAS